MAWVEGWEEVPIEANCDRLAVSDLPATAPVFKATLNKRWCSLGNVLSAELSDLRNAGRLNTYLMLEESTGLRVCLASSLTAAVDRPKAAKSPAKQTLDRHAWAW